MKGRKREETREYRGEQLDFYGRQIIKEAVDPSGVLKSPQRKIQSRTCTEASENLSLPITEPGVNLFV